VDATTDLPSIEELYAELDNLMKDMPEKDKFDFLRGVTPQSMDSKDNVVMEIRQVLQKINLCKRC